MEKTSDEKESLNVEQEEKVVEAQNEVNKQQPADQDHHGEAETKQETPEQRPGFGGEESIIYHLFIALWPYKVLEFLL